MTLLQLQYALECVSTGSISKAAENIYTTTSNLSKMIKALEMELGFTLFIRNSNGIVPTKNGELFFSHAQNIIAELEKIKDLTDRDAPQKFLIASQSNPYVCAAFSELVNIADANGQGMNYSLYVCSDMEAINLLKTDQCDMAVIEMPEAYERRFLDQMSSMKLNAKAVARMQVYVIINRDNPVVEGYREGDDFDFARLRACPCVGYPKRGFFEFSYHPRVSRNLPDMVDPDKYIELNNYPWRDTIISHTNAFSVGFFAPRSLLESKHLIGIPVPDSYGHLFCLTRDGAKSELSSLFIKCLEKALDDEY